MKQVNVALPDEIRGYLEEIAAKNGRKLSEEIRARLDQSVVDDRFDATTKEFGRDVMWLAHLAAKGANSATWSADRHLLEQVRKSIDFWMTNIAQTLGLPGIAEEARREAERLGEHNARAFADIKPMLIKHRPGGDNLEDKQ